MGYWLTKGGRSERRNHQRHNSKCTQYQLEEVEDINM